MKKILSIFAALLVGVLAFSSCEKEGGKNYYMYNSDIKTTIDCQTQVINDALAPRLLNNGNLYHLTESEAKAEWRDFLKSVDDSKVVMQPGSYYTVQLLLLTGEDLSKETVFKEKTWGSK